MNRDQLSASQVNYHAQREWAMRGVAERCQIVASAAGYVAEIADELIDLSRTPQRRDDTQTVAAELIPLCDAIAWLGRRGHRILKKRQLGWLDCPLWLAGVGSEVRRVPHGHVLIIGTWNYPILLTGVQMAQALAAGNAVLVKPAPGCEQITARLLNVFRAGGVPPAVMTMLETSPQAAQNAIASGVDLVVLTGSAATGRKVLQQTAQSITPTILELSGVDGVIVLPGADLTRLAKAIRFGLMFNSGATCIGPRRLFYQVNEHPELIQSIVELLQPQSDVSLHPAAIEGVVEAVSTALAQGATDVMGRFSADRVRETGRMPPVVLTKVSPDQAITEMDLFGPVISCIEVTDPQQAIDQVNGCAYRLAASVFGPVSQARTVAEKLHVGSVCVNDLIAPTADPRLPFGGQGQSGFGVTRGREGLLAMTKPLVISTRKGRSAPHLNEPKPADAQRLVGFLQYRHAKGLQKRLAAVKRMLTGNNPST